MVVRRYKIHGEGGSNIGNIMRSNYFDNLVLRRYSDGSNIDLYDFNEGVGVFPARGSVGSLVIIISSSEKNFSKLENNIGKTLKENNAELVKFDGTATGEPIKKIK